MFGEHEPELVFGKIFIFDEYFVSLGGFVSQPQNVTAWFLREHVIPTDIQFHVLNSSPVHPLPPLHMEVELSTSLSWPQAIPS